MTSLFLVLIAVIIITCIWLNNISARIGVPTLLAFILLGIIFGNVDTIPVQLEDHTFAKDVCTVALIFIMFYGGFGTRWEAVRPIMREAGLLASAGVVVTAGLTGLFCHYALQWGWAESFLLGAVVSSTDAASVFSILRSKNLGLRNNSAPILEVESGSNDPCAYMLTAVMISVMHGTASGGSVAWMLFAQVVFGAALGWGIAKLAILALQRMHFSAQGFDTLLVFAVAIASYAIPDLVGGNGYLSAYIVGVMLGNEEFRGKKSMVAFFDGITGLMQVLIFFLLGLLAKPSQLHRAILPALAIFLFMLIIARPAAVFGILTPFRKYSFRQQALISFVGLRGAASIVFAIMAASGAGVLHMDLFNIVFCLVLISMLLQGSLIPQVSKRLDMIDRSVNVLQTFNDFSENAPVQFGSLEITEDSPWNGKMVRELQLPRNILLALIHRGKERILPRGHTMLQTGDKIIIMTQAFQDGETHLYEKTVKPTSRRVGHMIKEHPGDGLVILVIRGSENIIPSGDTVLLAGDRLIILNLDV